LLCHRVLLARTRHDPASRTRRLGSYSAVPMPQAVRRLCLLDQSRILVQRYGAANASLLVLGGTIIANLIDTRMDLPQTNPKLLIRQSDHRFYLGMGVFMTMLVFLGFWPTYFQPLLNSTYEGTLVLHIHAIFFLAWMATYLLQSTLVIRRKTPVHKRWGLPGMYLGAVMFMLGLLVATLLVRRHGTGGCLVCC